MGSTRVRPAATTGGVGRMPGLRSAAARAAGGRRVFVALARVLPHPGPRARRRLLALLLAVLVLGAAYRLWIRDAPFASVDRVTVTGLSTDDAERVRAALVSTARTMTTLHVERDRLEKVVAGYPVVRALEVEADFPHALRIRVVEHKPVLVALTGGARLPVAADGTVLEGLPIEGPLPVVETEGGLKSNRLADADAVGAAHIAGAAPLPLRRRLREIERDGDRGYVARLRRGPELIFGSAAHLRAKWVAAARVLADGETRGATYVDLRVPGRPAVGGLGFEVSDPALVTPPGLALGPEDGAVAGATAEQPAAPEAGIAPVEPGVEQAPPEGEVVPEAPGPSEPVAPAGPTAEAGGGAVAAPTP